MASMTSQNKTAAQTSRVSSAKYHGYRGCGRILYRSTRKFTLLCGKMCLSMWVCDMLFEHQIVQRMSKPGDLQVSFKNIARTLYYNVGDNIIYDKRYLHLFVTQLYGVICVHSLESRLFFLQDVAYTRILNSLAASIHELSSRKWRNVPRHSSKSNVLAKALLLSRRASP